MAEQVTFGSLSVGARFTLNHPDNGPTPFVNIKVPESRVLAPAPDGGPWIPFNVIALDGGRPRTFGEHERVYPLPWVDHLGYPKTPEGQ